MAVLPRYIARRLLGSVAAAFLVLFLLVVFADFVNLIQRIRENSTVTFTDVAVLSLQRTPVIMEAVFPFTVLFGSIAAFISLSRRMELVVARASGVSIWQILTPALIAAALLGIAVMTVFNPVSAALHERSISLEAELFPSGSSSQPGRWLRQQSEDGQSILRATGAVERGAKLAGVTAFVFSHGGAFEERVRCQQAPQQACALGPVSRLGARFGAVAHRLAPRLAEVLPFAFQPRLQCR